MKNKQTFGVHTTRQKSFRPTAWDCSQEWVRTDYRESGVLFLSDTISLRKVTTQKNFNSESTYFRPTKMQGANKK